MTTISTRTLQYQIDLPYPVSANRLWSTAGARAHARSTRIFAAPHLYLSRQYVSWIKEADGLYLAQKRAIGPVCTLGAYTLDCVFARAKRSPIQDGDNLCKAVHDWLQRVEIIHNDCLCEGASWKWGEAPSGCHITVEGRPWE